MASTMYLQNNTRAAVAEATRYCREREVAASNTFLAFVVRTIALQVPGKFNMESPMTLSALRNLAEAAVERVSVDGDAAVEAIKMEVEVEQEYIAQGKALHEEAKEKDEQTMSLELAITSARYRSDADDAEFFTELYRKVFTYVASGPGMEAALTHPESEGETLAALDSVFPQHGLRRFLSLSREDKVAQLKELRAIVLGIRIFNRLIGKGSETLDEPVAPFEAQANALIKNLKMMIVDAQQELDQYEAVLEFKGTQLRPTEDPMPALRAVHSNRLVFLDLSLFLLEQVEKGLHTVQSLSAQYEAEQEAVRELVGARSAVPKEKVYPKLEALGTLHTLLLQDRRMLVVLARVTDKLQHFLASFEPIITMKDVQDAERLEQLGALLNDAGPPSHPDPNTAAELAGAELLSWEEACTDGTELPALRCGGFSVVTAVKRGGLLLRATPEAAVVRWQDGLYGFVNEDEARDFAANPKEYTDALHKVVVMEPELVRLLRMEDVLPSLRMADVVDVMTTPLTCDYGTQTPTHFVEKHLDRNYEWNVWALRRRVLQLANLRQKRTHSTQTNLSHYRREQETQLWMPKQSATQTLRQKGTTMPQKKMYMEGLRGAPDVRMNIVNVDLDLGQPHEY